MILRRPVGLYVFVLILSAAVVRCNEYSDGSKLTGSCAGEFCEAKDEYDEPCMDEGTKDDHGGIEEEPNIEDTDDDEPENEAEQFDYPKEGLFRWDPIKVS